MNIRSRFDLDQTVWHIRNIGVELFDACPSCAGGKVQLPDGRTLNCPRCSGKGVITLRHGHRYRVSEPMRVGQIRIQVGGRDEQDAEQYMTYETGVGSGSLYYGNDLFADRDLAQAECDRRNNEPGRAWACTQCNIEFEQSKYSGWSEWRWCPVHKNSTLHVDIEKHKEIISARAKATGGDE